MRLRFSTRDLRTLEIRILDKGMLHDRFAVILFEEIRIRHRLLNLLWHTNA
jgi:hypothetical protein